MCVCFIMQFPYYSNTGLLNSIYFSYLQSELSYVPAEINFFLFYLLLENPIGQRRKNVIFLNRCGCAFFHTHVYHENGVSIKFLTKRKQN